jgi:predicted outer membrane repeat protein
VSPIVPTALPQPNGFTDGMSLYQAGGNILVFQTGPPAGAPTNYDDPTRRFITAILANIRPTNVGTPTSYAAWDVAPNVQNESSIPPSLTNGTTCFLMSPGPLPHPTSPVPGTVEPDNGKFSNCALSLAGTCTALQMSALIYTTTNWTYSNTVFPVTTSSSLCTYSIAQLITITAPNVTQPTCSTPTGTIVVNAAGTGTLEYSIDGGSTWFASNTFSGLAPNSYTISVHSLSNPTCITNYSSNPVVLSAATGCCITNPIVINNNDAGLGSLRQAIIDACPGSNITFDPSVTGTITLASTLPVITKALTITGPGANILSVSGNNVVQVFTINSSSLVSIIGLTIANGNDQNSFGGGAINAQGTGNLTVTNCTFSNNTTNGFRGGAIHAFSSNFGQLLSVSGSTFSGNSVLLSGGGGGAIGSDATCSIVNCTFTGNSAKTAGGAILLNNTSSITNCTITGNSITGNGTGGGIYAPCCASYTILNSIIAGNTSAGVGPDISGPFTSTNNNILGIATASVTGFTNGVNGNQVGTVGSPINPLLGPLQDNGGPTFTMALLTNSLAIDKGSAVAGLTTDQRGTARPFDIPSIANATGGDGSDIGAFEVQCTVPVVTCPGNIISNNTTGQCNAAVNYSSSATGIPDPVITYEFTGATSGNGSGNGSGSTFNVGVTTVTLTATNDCGNNSCTFSVTVVDAQNPTITCPANITVNNTANQCGAMVTYAATASDNCPGVSVSYSPASGSFFPVGTTTVTATATDGAGHTASCTFSVTVVDAQNPTITCPANITVNNTANQCGAMVTYAATASDNCTGVSVSYSPVSGSFFPVGTTTVTATATDGAGHTASCTFSVTVVDAQNPTITCPANITVNNTANQCGAMVTYAATASDNCTGVSVSYSPVSGSFFPVGTTTVTATATDAAGRTASCTFTVTVVDNEKPVITAPAILSCYQAGNNGCSINLGASATDNCALQSLTSNAPACFPVGTTTVTWTATDVNGNVSTKTQTVTRNPEINVSICAAITRTIYRGSVGGNGPFGPQSINLNSTALGGTPGYTYKWLPATGLSNSNIANPVASPSVTTTYTLTVTDSKGCTRSLSITINVLPLSAAVCSGSGNNAKFNVCHVPTDPPYTPVNICISASALPAHLIPGTIGHNNCTLGPCGQQLCFSNSSSQTAPATSVVTFAEVVKDEMVVKAYPNPSDGDFRIQVTSNSDEPVTVRILDVTGVMKSVSLMNTKTNIIKVGANLPSGTYTAEVIQGTKRQMIKLVKLK